MPAARTLYLHNAIPPQLRDMSLEGGGSRACAAVVRELGSQKCPPPRLDCLGFSDFGRNRLPEDKAFAEPASEERIQAVAEALERANIEVLVVDSGDEARSKVFEMVPDEAEVYSAKSKTLEDIGVASELESGRFDSVRARHMAMDRETQMREIRKLMAAPDYMLGSANALTDGGELLTASYSGSQIGPYAASAGRVILVIGSQKIVKDLDEGFRRMRERVFPYEDERLREQLGVGTKAAKILIQSAEGRPGRTTVILVREPVGV